MRFVSINDVREGMVLAKDLKIYNYSGVCDLITKGNPISSSNLERLKRIGSSGMYILDEGDKLIHPESIIDEKLKNEAVIGIEKLFSDAGSNNQRVNTVLLENVNKLSEKILYSLVTSQKFLTNILDLKMYDEYTYHHSLSVSILSISIGLALNFNNQELSELSLCSILHDIGKTQIPIGLISKPDRLSHDEFEIVKEHSRLGAEYIKKSSLITTKIYNGILSHHERYDGNGYPFRISGENIPLFGRIISIADVYDAITSNRPYRKSATPSEAIEYIMGGNGVLFDPNIVSAFLKKIAPYPINDYVKLSNGEEAIVIKIYPENPLRPKVRVVNEAEEKNINSKIYDLYNDMTCMNIVITEEI